MTLDNFKAWLASIINVLELVSSPELPSPVLPVLLAVRAQLDKVVDEPPPSLNVDAPQLPALPGQLVILGGARFRLSHDLVEDRWVLMPERAWSAAQAQQAREASQCGERRVPRYASRPVDGSWKL